MCNIIKWNLSYSRFLQYFSKIIILNESESHSIMSTSLWPHGLCSPWNSPGQDSLVGSLSLLQRIFTTQRSNPCFLHYRWILYQLSHKGSPRILEWVAYPFSSRSSWPRNWTRVSCIAEGFFTNWSMRVAQILVQEAPKSRPGTTNSTRWAGDDVGNTASEPWFCLQICMSIWNLRMWFCLEMRSL